MADYINFFNKLAASYRYPQTVDGVAQSIKQQMKQRFDFDYYPPTYNINYVITPRQHPYGGLMNNWTDSPSFYEVDFDKIASDVNYKRLLSGSKRIRTMPDLKMTMNLNPFVSNLDPIKRHEFIHMNIFAIPYNLTYFFAQKRYDALKRAGLFREPFNKNDLDSLATDVWNWLYDDFKPRPMNLRKDYKVEPRIDKFTNFVDSLNWVHDSYENENNVYYAHSALEKAMMDFYDDAIKEMDYWNPTW